MSVAVVGPCLVAISASAGVTEVTPPAPAPNGIAQSDWANIRQAYDHHRHGVVSVQGGLEARNPGQQLTTRFDSRGFLTRPDGATWQWGLELQSYGFLGHEQSVSEKCANVRRDGGRVTYDWDNKLQEWFINDQRGLEHGFTVKSRPAGAAVNSQPATLDFLLSIRGGLCPQVQPDGTGVAFMTSDGNAVLTYDGLTVLDADGRKLPARFDTTPDSRLLRIAIDERGARYPLTVDPFVRQAYLKASNTGAGDYFGQAVAISGDTVVVGAIFEDSSATGVNGNQNDNTGGNSGAAYVFVRNGNFWSQQAYLKASNTGADDNFGIDVAISGDTIVVGADREDSSATGVNGDQALNNAGNSGAAYVFVRNGTTWTQQAYLKASNTGASDQFGSAVAISGDTIVVGAYREDSNATGVNGNESDNSAVDSGATYVFVRNGTTWSQQAYLKASNTEAADYFGGSVAIASDTILVGSEGEDSNATGIDGNQSDNSALLAGAAYVFVRDGTTWAQQAYLKASNTEGGDGFGVSVSVSGDTALIGAWGEDSSAGGVNGNQASNGAGQSGAGYVFTRNGNTWTQQAYLKAPSPAVQAYFGRVAALSGDVAILGAPENFSLSGSAHIYVRSVGNWTHENTFFDYNINPVESDLFGRSVAVSGQTVVIGQPLEDSNATGINGSLYDTSSANSGAAFVYVVPRTQVNLLVNVDATGLPAGPLTAVTNSGSMGGFFEARGGGTSIPIVAAVGGGGTMGIRFDGGDYLQHVATLGGSVLPANGYLVGLNPPCTIETWVLNGAIDRDEVILAWGKRGGPDGSNQAFNYGWDAAWGALGHWGAPDLGWTSGQDGGGVYATNVPAAGQWHHLVYTFDGVSQRVYSDGILKNSEGVSLNTHSGPPIILGGQTDANGTTVTATLRGSLTIGRVRIYDGALSAAQIATNYNLEIGAFTNGPGDILVSGPTHRYQFNNAAGAATPGSVILDSVGTANGTVLGASANFTGSRLTLPGGASGTAAYVDLPDGLLSANSTNKGGTGEVTIEGWIRVTGNRAWSRILDIGSSSGGTGQDYLMYGAQVNTDVYTHRLEVKNADAVGGTGGGGTVDHGSTTYGTNVHFAITWNDATGELIVYENGAFAIRRTETARLSQINDVNVWLGRSQYTGDQNLQGELDEFRIYNRVLSEAELRGNFLRGPDTISANNTRPLVANPIPDTNGFYGTPFSLTFAANTFSDPDAGQTLSYGASGLPAGLTFTSATRTFGGTPTAVGLNSVTATATDNGAPALSTNDVFDIVIAKAPLTATAQNKFRTYAETNPPLTVSYSGFVLGEDASVLDTQPVISTTATNGSPVGAYPISLSGGDDDHYGLSYTAGTLAITPSPLTVTANDATRVYGTTNPPLTGSIVGVAHGDNITVNFSTTADAASPPGSYPITPVISDPDGKLVNYSVTTNVGTLTIEPPPIMQVELPPGTNLDAGTAIYFGGMQSRYVDPTTQTQAADSTFTVTFTGIFPNPYATYQIQYANTPFGIWSQLPAPGLSPNAAGVIEFHDPTPRLVAYYRLLIITDTHRVFTIRNPGTTGLTGISVTVLGTNAANFELNLAGTATSLAPGSTTTFTVTYVAFDTNARTAQLQITGNLLSAFTLTLIGGEVAPPNHAPDLANPIVDTGGVYGALFNLTFAANTFNDPDAGQALSYSASGLPSGITFTPATRTFSGTPTSVGTNSVTLSATDNGSPALSTNDVFDIVIAKAPLSATADNKSRTYAETNPPLTFGYSSFVLGETAAVLDAPPTISSDATNGSPVGSYSITVGGGTDDHYELSYVSGTLNVTAAELIVTANNTNRVYGTTNPPLTGSLVGIVNDDNITATFLTAATIADPPGAYPITPALSDPDGRLSNYTTTTNLGILTITSPPELSITTGTGGSITLSWPASYSGFVLERTENLAVPIEWHEVTSGITESGGIKTYTVVSDLNFPWRFFRLRLY